jgi:hypothetical protein
LSALIGTFSYTASSVMSPTIASMSRASFALMSAVTVSPGVAMIDLSSRWHDA